MSETNPSSPGGLAATIAQKAVEPFVRAIRGEISAATREIRSRVAGARTGVVLVAVGAVFGVLGLGLLASLVVALLSLSLPLWSAVAITLGCSIVIAAILAVVGLRLIRRGVPPVPKDTLSATRDRLAKHK